MKYLPIILVFIILNTSLVAKEVNQSQTLHTFTSQKEYTRAVNEHLEMSHQEKIVSAKSQGRIEWVLFIGLIVIFISPLILSLIKKEPLSISLRHIVVWLPLILFIITLFPLLVSGGEWGSMKHSILHDWFSGFVINELLVKITVYFMPLINGMIYLILFIEKKIKRKEVVLSLILYLLFYAGFLVYVNALGALASQGAGH
jgi:uncharacterized membrane protein YobD (UPF0266 family)